MKLPHVQSVDVVRNGIVVTYDDSSCAFYHESLLLIHLQKEPSERSPAKRSKNASSDRKTMEPSSAQPVRRKLASLRPGTAKVSTAS